MCVTHNLYCVLPPAGEQGVCAWPMGRAAAGAGLPAQPKPGAREHPERQAGPAQHDQLILRPAHRLPHLRVPPHHLLRRGPRPAALCLGRAREPPQHLHLVHQQLGQVRDRISSLISTNPSNIHTHTPPFALEQSLHTNRIVISLFLKF